MREYQKRISDIVPRMVALCAYLAMALSFVGIVLMLVFSFNGYIWADEAYSLRIIQYSYREIVEMCAGDVHPPLYYMALKLVQDMAAFLFQGFYSTVVIGKLFSLVPYLLLTALCWRKLSDVKSVRPFVILCIYAAPQLIAYGVEVRMYGWAMFFVSASFLYARDIMKNDSSKKSWSFLTVFSVLSAYTHTFALVAMASVWFCLLLWCLWHRKSILTCIGFGGLVVICFLPWLLVLLNQVRYVNQSYWIQPITWGNVLEYITYPFGNVWFFLLLAIPIGIMVSKEKPKKAIFEAGFGILVPILTILAGVAVSLVVRPVFVDRYMLPGLLCFWISLFLLSAKCKPGWQLVAAVCILVSAVSVFLSFGQSEVEEAKDARENLTLVESFEEDAIVIVSCDTHVADVLAAYTPHMVYNWRGPELNYQTTKYREAFTNEFIFDDTGQIEEWLDSGIPLYYIEVSTADALLKFPLENDLWKMTYIGDCSFETEAKAYKINRN